MLCTHTTALPRGGLFKGLVGHLRYGTRVGSRQHNRQQPPYRRAPGAPNLAAAANRGQQRLGNGREEGLLITQRFNGGEWG